MPITFTDKVTVAHLGDTEPAYYEHVSDWYSELRHTLKWGDGTAISPETVFEWADGTTATLGELRSGEYDFMSDDYWPVAPNHPEYVNV